MKTKKDQALSEFADRLNQACDYMDVPDKGRNRQAAIAVIFGVSQKGARKWLEGEGYPTFDKLVQIALWSGVGVEWLLTGREASEFPAEARLPATLPNDVARVASKIAALSPARRAALDQLLDAFSA